MINVKRNNEIIAQAKNWTVANNYFRFKISHNKKREDILGKPIMSKKYNITVVLEEIDIVWHKNQSIVFLKKIEEIE